MRYAQVRLKLTVTIFAAFCALLDQNMPITHLTSTSQLNDILSKSADKLSVIDFHATWCGPCHAIAPTFEALSKQYTNVNFLKCDVDAAKDVASTYRVSAMPTFIFLKGSTKVDQVRGANKAALEDALRRHSSGSSSAAFTGKGQTLSGSSPAAGQGEGPGVLAEFNKLDPQVKVLVYLVLGYIVFWYMS
ncbi:thioredoxin-domain-containing protein [Amylocystis lapponica]|nr:thioredoxin-domain-containing protein [Amylocystis lapponica]